MCLAEVKYPYFLKTTITRIVIRIVIVFFKYIPYFAVLFAFYRQLKSGKYHPGVALLHNMVEEDFKEGFIRF